MSKVSTLVSKEIGNYLTNRASWNIFYNAKDEGMAGDGTTDDYADLSTLINTTINGAEATIIFSPGTYKISTSITVPSNITLFITKGAMLSPDSGKIITINGPVEAGLWKIFTGSGKIAGAPKVEMFYPQWWGAKGDGITDDTAAIQACIDINLTTTDKWCHIDFPAGIYLISDSLKLPETTLTLNKRFLFTGAGPLITKIKQSVATKAIFDIQDLGVAGTMNTWRDLGFVGVSNTETMPTSMPAIYGHLTIGVRVFNCWFTGFYRAISMEENGLGTGSKELYVFYNTFEFCTTAIYGTDFSMATLMGNEYSTSARIETNKHIIDLDTSSNIIIVGEKFNFGIGRGINLTTCTDVQLSSLDFSDVDGTPAATYGRVNISMTSCTGVQVSGSIFSTPIAEGCIEVKGGNTKIKINDNRFKDSVGEAAILFSGSSNEVEILDNTFENMTFDGIKFSSTSLVNSVIHGNNFKTIAGGFSYIKATDIIAKSVSITGNHPEEKLCITEGTYHKNLKLNVTSAGARNSLQIALIDYGLAEVTARINGLSQGSGSKGYDIVWRIYRNTAATTITVKTAGAAYGISADALTLDLTASGNDVILSYTVGSASGFIGDLDVEIVGNLNLMTLL